MWTNLTSQAFPDRDEVKKSMPDQADMHIVGGGARGRLRPVRFRHSKKQTR